MRFSATFTLEHELKEMVWSTGEWIDLGQLAKNKKSDSARYMRQEFSAELYGIEYRFMMVHSSKLNTRNARKLDRELG